MSIREQGKRVSVVQPSHRYLLPTSGCSHCSLEVENYNSFAPAFNVLCQDWEIHPVIGVF